MTVTADIVRLYKQARKIIKARIQQAVSKPNLTADIWTKTGMASSYLDNPSFAGVCAEMKNNLNARFDFMIDKTMDTFLQLFVSGEPAVQNIVTRHINKTSTEMVSLIFFKPETSLDDGSENEINPAKNNAGQENEGKTADGGPRNLNAHQFKLLYAKTLSSAPESSNDYRQTGLRRSKIPVELLGYVSMDFYSRRG
ncbi:hypothetical protein GHT06_004572 [Daphnia sinensis]|uniref:Uncharacterized protein n=1 Tax=Daphnia sinensis TaxID=1820382 RepID=A0AAD5PLL1_9CRUS|nr:hypothetical protein GHT06_004572 [Daphnia sinensis]